MTPLLGGAGPIRNWMNVEEYHGILVFSVSNVGSVQSKYLSVVQTAAGKYTLTLPRAYRTLVEVRFSLQRSSGAVVFPVVASETVSTDGKVFLEMRTEAGTATHPGINSKGLLVVSVSNNPFNDYTL